MPRLLPILSFFPLLSFFSLAMTTPVDFDKRIVTSAYRDLVELSTRQSKMAGNYTLPPLPYSYDVSMLGSYYHKAHVPDKNRPLNPSSPNK